MNSLLQNDTTLFICIAIFAYFALSYISKMLPKRYKGRRVQRCAGSRREPRLSKSKTTRGLFQLQYAAKPLLNKSEEQFFYLLSGAMPDYHIFPQVSFNALLTHAPHVWRRDWKWRIRRKFNTKYVDYVLCKKPGFEVLAVVEYDGKGHRSWQDDTRDALLKSVGYRVERFSPPITVEGIEERFAEVSITNSDSGIEVQKQRGLC